MSASPRVRVGLMGLGRIGRNLFRQLQHRDDVELRALADAADPEALVYLLRFDTLLGRFPGTIELADGRLRVGEREVRLRTTADPAAAAWGESEVEVVIDTVPGRRRADLEAHLASGATKVLVCGAPAEASDLTLVEGFNHHRLEPRHRIVSNGSCTAHAVVPVLAALDEAFGVERAFLSTVHSYSDQQRLADVPADDWRMGRAAAENIIPLASNAAQVLGELLPALAGRISAASINVPVPDGSGADLTVWHARPVTTETVNEAVRRAAAASGGRLAFETEPIVSSDVLLSPATGTFDAAATMVVGGRISKTLTWFDNGWAYAGRALDAARRLGLAGRSPAAAAGGGAAR